MPSVYIYFWSELFISGISIIFSFGKKFIGVVLLAHCPLRDAFLYLLQASQQEYVLGEN